MSDLRAVPLDEEQFCFIEQLGLEQSHAGEHERATKLLAIALAWKVAPQVRGGGNGASPETEHGPLPRVDSTPDNVVELHGWSKKVPCT